MWNTAHHKLSVVFIIITSLILTINGRSSSWLKKIQLCDPNADYDTKFNVSITSNENKQYVDGMLILKSPLDNNLGANVSVEMLAGNKYVHLSSITERKSCEAFHKYFGEFAYDVERQAQLIPGMCPIPKGKYQVHNFLLNYQKITTISNFPVLFGRGITAFILALPLRERTMVISKSQYDLFILSYAY